MKGLAITASASNEVRIQGSGVLFSELFRTFNDGSEMILSVGSAAGIIVFLYIILYLIYGRIL